MNTLLSGRSSGPTSSPSNGPSRARKSTPMYQHSKETRP